MREFGTYGSLMALTIPAAFVIALAVVQRGLRQARYGATAALFLLFGIPLLGGGILFLVYGLPWICFDSCPPDIAASISSISGPLLIALALGAVCCGTGWVLAMLALARQRMWLRFSLILLLLPLVLLISAAALSHSIQGRLAPHTEDELSSWVMALDYVVLPVALCWPLGTILIHGLPVQPPARSASLNPERIGQ
ncbi:MAG TPA: hypothetical protein VH349_19200 [Ktedonobacterales bacterium]|jgi:hypothetical protein